MSVELDPPELGFRRPFTHEVTQLLRLRNPSSEPIAFKVKTTAPKQYCVRPNSGKIDAGQDVEVQVLLQAMRDDPPPDARCRDKFLVQTVAISQDSDASNIQATWQQIEKANKSSIQERKIRVAFLAADGSAPRPSNQNLQGAHLSDDAPPAYGSPAPSFGSPGPEAVTPINRSVKPESDNKGQAGMGNSTSMGAGASSAVNAGSSSDGELRTQLADANATISRLKQQAEEQGLRQRKSDAVNQDARERITTGTTGMGVQQQPADGVPVQIVAALCLLSFLLAYFFF
ncbi:MAG: hypothetical protein Q9174_000293 [Haloplaca sp. 1 TL-2023]